MIAKLGELNLNGVASSSGIGRKFHPTRMAQHCVELRNWTEMCQQISDL